MTCEILFRESRPDHTGGAGAVQPEQAAEAAA